MSDQGEQRDTNACARWDIPQIDERLPAVGGSGGHAGAPGYDDGFAQGRDEALAVGRQAVQAQVDVLQRLMCALAEPFSELDEAVETELLSLATTIAQQIVRRELSTDPTLVLTVIQESVALLPTASRELTLKLHPEDAQLVREHMTGQIEEGQWHIMEDATCMRGGCVVTTGHARIDASIEQQIASIAESVLGSANTGTVES